MNAGISVRSFPVSDAGELKEKVLNWARRFDTFCFLDNHDYSIAPHTLDCILGAGVRRQISPAAKQPLDQVDPFLAAQEGWSFGHLSYDLSFDLEGTSSRLKPTVPFPHLFFFEPVVVVRMTGTSIIIEAEDPGVIYDHIVNSQGRPAREVVSTAVQARIPKEDYMGIIEKLRQHILRGDCYEINFCQEFYCEDVQLDPLWLYQRLMEVSPNPFSALYRLGETWLVCASPERFLKKQGTHLLSQPIKGTSRRDTGNMAIDTRIREELFQSQKDRSENVMVVDLVRNDLSRVCREGTVKVDELYGIYSFPQVHQMISTVSGELREGISFSDIMRATFPMGSMTGAPKKRVVELIDRYEATGRGIFSGSVGYFTPGGDFDFNVVIRSIIYDTSRGYLSFPTGSGITFYSEPEKEWEECLLKARAIKQVLAGK